MEKNSEIYNWPNFVSFIRMLMVPVLFYFAINKQPYIFIGVIIFSEFTDVLDGFLARWLNQITELGSHLDSWGDFLIYTSMAVCAWILWPEIIQKEWFFFVLIIMSVTLPVLAGLIKFRSVTSYHTWSVKLAVAITVVGYILLFLELLSWPFYLATAVCVYAAVEEILITLIMKHQHVDVRTVWAAIKYNKT
jgi:cardiolipin synthase (CMP-forming)